MSNTGAVKKLEPNENRIQFYTVSNFEKLPQVQALPEETRHAIKTVAQVLPFRVNNYVVNELIDWSDIPNDPIFQLTFMQKGMLEEDHFEAMSKLVKEGAHPKDIRELSNKIRFELNPHPAGQLTHNVPKVNDEPVRGLQHKYRETVLMFPASGQTCFSYCTFCFRWPQFVGMSDLKFSTDKDNKHIEYLREHKEVTDVLVTGGDPMIMNAKMLRNYLSPLLEKDFDHIQTIRIGTKVLGFWPYRFLTDKDSEDILEFFEELVAAGKNLAIMSHFNHWKELSTDAVKEATRKIQATGAIIRTQAPLLRHINNSPETWVKMWNEQVKLGLVPYYMFVERDTGPRQYFELPLAETFHIYREAHKRVSGLARTARGPSMSAHPGKVCVEDILEINGEKVFALKFLQARNPDWNRRLFFAKYDEKATWLSDLKPAFGEEKFFFEDSAA